MIGENQCGRTDDKRRWTIKETGGKRFRERNVRQKWGGMETDE